MAANEVIFFLFWAQLSLRLAFPAPPPPEPVAESPPEKTVKPTFHSVAFSIAALFVCLNGCSDTVDAPRRAKRFDPASRVPRLERN
jgi:hypothetical protein